MPQHVRVEKGLSLRDEIWKETTEWLVIGMMVVLIVFGLLLVELFERADEVRYLSSRVDSLELAIRWGSELPPPTTAPKGGERR